MVRQDCSHSNILPTWKQSPIVFHAAYNHSNICLLNQTYQKRLNYPLRKTVKNGENFLLFKNHFYLPGIGPKGLAKQKIILILMNPLSCPAVAEDISRVGPLSLTLTTYLVAATCPVVSPEMSILSPVTCHTLRVWHHRIWPPSFPPGLSSCVSRVSPTPHVSHRLSQAASFLTDQSFLHSHKKCGLSLNYARSYHRFRNWFPEIDLLLCLIIEHRPMLSAIYPFRHAYQYDIYVIICAPYNAYINHIWITIK